MRSVRWAWPVVALVAAFVASAPGCGSSNNGYSPDDGGLGDGTDDGTVTDQNAPDCPTGTSCGDGGVCAGNVVLRDGRAPAATPAARPATSARSRSAPRPARRASTRPTARPPTTATTRSAETTRARRRRRTARAWAARCSRRGAACRGRRRARPTRAPDGGLTCLENCEYHPHRDFTPVLKFAWGGQLTRAVRDRRDDDAHRDRARRRRLRRQGQRRGHPGDRLHDASPAATTRTTARSTRSRSSAGQGRRQMVEPGEVYPQGQLAAGDIDACRATRSSPAAPTARCARTAATARSFWPSAAGLACSMPSIADLDARRQARGDRRRRRS